MASQFLMVQNYGEKIVGVVYTLRMFLPFLLISGFDRSFIATSSVSLHQI
jgi:hypothetical protein